MKKHMNTRETLLLKLRDQNNEKAWAEFFEIYKGFIFAILIKLNIQKEDQDDLVQEILLKAWKNLPKFEYKKNGGKFRNWLAVVVSNTAMTYFRKLKGSENSMNKIILENKTEPEIGLLTENEWKLFISKKAWENVKQSLTENVISCFELLSDGMELNEVGEKLGIPYNTVCVYKKRVINKISREINRLEEEFG